MSRSVFRIELIFVCDAVKGVQLHPYAEDVQLSVPICYALFSGYRIFGDFSLKVVLALLVIHDSK